MFSYADVSPYGKFTLVDSRGKPLEGVTDEDIASSDLKLFLASLSANPQCHWMLDLETMGLENNAAIVQVGIAPFNPKGTGLYTQEFKNGVRASVTHSQVLSLKEQPDRVCDPETLEWWKTKNVDNLHLLETTETVTLTEELYLLSFLLSKYARVWAKSPSFDVAIIRHACKLRKVALQVSFRNELDVRTMEFIAGFAYGNMKSVFDASDKFWGRERNAHDALNDVFTQIFIVQEAFKRMTSVKEDLPDLTRFS